MRNAGLAAAIAVLWMACDGGPTALTSVPDFRKGGKGPSAQYEFVYAEQSGALESDCWHLPGPYHLFWCGSLDQDDDPTLVLRVVRDGAPVEGGTVTFRRCESVNQRVIMPWYYCGSRLGKGRDKWFDPFPYGDPVEVGPNGMVSLTLQDWGAGEGVEAETGVWGMWWTYDAGNGGKVEADAKWHSLAPDDYCDPIYPDCY
jgi:hypothetical protein